MNSRLHTDFVEGSSLPALLLMSAVAVLSFAFLAAVGLYAVFGLGVALALLLYGHWTAGVIMFALLVAVIIVLVLDR